RRLARARHRPPPLPAPAASHSRRCPRAGRARGGGAPRRGPRPLSLRSRPTDHHAGRQRDRRPRPRRRDRLRHDHLVSWAGLCPRLDESAGKRLSTRTRPSNPWLKTTLVQAAWAASRKKDGYLRAQFLRLKSRRGPKKAILAVAASMLTAAYHMLKHDVDYHDLGGDHFDRRDKAKIAHRLIQGRHALQSDPAHWGPALGGMTETKEAEHGDETEEAGDTAGAVQSTERARAPRTMERPAEVRIRPAAGAGRK